MAALLRPAYARPLAAVGLLATVLGGAGVGCAAAPPRPVVAQGAASAPVEYGRLLFADDFRGGLDRWVVEQQPGGTVRAEGGRLVISDRGGCTVWRRERLQAPVVIRYQATVSSGARVSDLNAFWMASDPARPGDLFARGHGRDGRFASYDALLTYYVGCGGNGNSTTRFRRYAGDGSRPIRPEHDLRDERFLLEPDRAYRVELVACGGRALFVRDGQVFFDVTDPEPLRTGWFGLRTVDSRLEIRDFRVFEARCR